MLFHVAAECLQDCEMYIWELLSRDVVGLDTYSGYILARWFGHVYRYPPPGACV